MIEITGLFGLILLVGVIYAVVKTVSLSASTGSKVLWILALLVLPVIGLIAWFIFGPKGKASIA